MEVSWGYHPQLDLCLGRDNVRKELESVPGSKADRTNEGPVTKNWLLMVTGVAARAEEEG